MNEKSWDKTSLFRVALLRAYNNLDSSTRALLGSCKLVTTRNATYWQIAFVAPSLVVWKRIVRRLESITRRFDETLSTFILAVCTSDDPVPAEVKGLGIIEQRFKVNQTKYVQLGNEVHPYWVQVVPSALLSKMDSKPALLPGARYIVNWKAIAQQGDSYFACFKKWLLGHGARETSVFIFTGKIIPHEADPNTMVAACQVEGKTLELKFQLDYLMDAPSLRKQLIEAEDDDDELLS